jgi:hypothetical protein
VLELPQGALKLTQPQQQGGWHLRCLPAFHAWHAVGAVAYVRYNQLLPT